MGQKLQDVINCNLNNNLYLTNDNDQFSFLVSVWQHRVVVVTCYQNTYTVSYGSNDNSNY